VTVVQHVPGIDGSCGQVLRALGFAPVMIPPTVVLELGFCLLRAVPGSMRAQYRRRARRVIEQSAHLAVEQRDRVADLAGELGRLVYERAKRGAAGGRHRGLFPRRLRPSRGERPSAAQAGCLDASFALLLADAP
jgi:hypothetical protein